MTTNINVDEIPVRLYVSGKYIVPLSSFVPITRVLHISSLIWREICTLLDSLFSSFEYCSSFNLGCLHFDFICNQCSLSCAFLFVVLIKPLYSTSLISRGYIEMITEHIIKCGTRSINYHIYR